jgi:two-component system nitrogen regulation sensor histidine kinase NtrY
MRYLPLFTYAKHLLSTRVIVTCIVLAAMVSGFATYTAIVYHPGSSAPDPYAALGLILIDLILLLALAVTLSRRLVSLWFARRRGARGSRLQGRIVLMFSLLATVPTIIVAIFSTLFFNIGIQSWFNDRVSMALEESVLVAEAYLNEHQEVLRNDVLAMKHDIEYQAYRFHNDAAALQQFASSQLALRSLTEATVFVRHPHTTPSAPGTANDEPAELLAQTEHSFSTLIRSLPEEIFERANAGEVAILSFDHADTVRALTKLDYFTDTYLLIGRFVDNKVLHHIHQTHGAADEYRRLTGQISSLQIKFSFVFVVVALLLLVASIWFGIVFASAIARPIGLLVAATERVKQGDLEVRVDERRDDDEIGILARGFNRMTEQLARQHQELVAANRKLDTRRRFSEMVLASVSAGILTVRKDNKIRLVNESAATILETPAAEMRRSSLSKHVSEFDTLVAKARLDNSMTVQEKITIVRHGRRRTLLVRASAENDANSEGGCILTFDDITDLVAAERSKVWSDVARRIAHEIKNPLTPIHLAAERLHKKFSGEVSDPEMLTRYTHTIVRHVQDINTMVEEFATFARMPAPKFATLDLAALVKDVVFSEQGARGMDIDFITEFPEEDIRIEGDASQLSQALINICKNAAEAIEAAHHKGVLPQDSKGIIKVTIAHSTDCCILSVTDNGIGLPETGASKLTEPYVTTRSRGTGLGLAIVKKIVEDHGASLQLTNNAEQGTTATIVWKLTR